MPVRARVAGSILFLAAMVSWMERVWSRAAMEGAETGARVRSRAKTARMLRDVDVVESESWTLPNKSETRSHHPFGQVWRRREGYRIT